MTRFIFFLFQLREEEPKDGVSAYNEASIVCLFYYYYYFTVLCCLNFSFTFLISVVGSTRIMASPTPVTCQPRQEQRVGYELRT